MTTDLKHEQWKGTTGGMPWMQRSLVHILGNIDARLIYAVVALVVPWYMLFAHRGYLAQYHFFRQRLGESWLKAFWHVYLNHYHFGQIIIDRFAAYGGREFRFVMDGYDDLWQGLARQPEGFVQLSSHIGNYELAGYSLKAETKQFNALVFYGETETVMNNRRKEFTPNNITMVPVMPDMSHIFTLNTALSNGEIVSMPGDRIFGSQKALCCQFFGSVARFPMGPFSLALARQCPTIAVFVMKEDWQTYRIVIRDIVAPLLPTEVWQQAKKNDRLQLMAQRFAIELETVVRQYPTQWFNYYEFWDNQ